jgi:hypothetical protein
MYGQGLMLGSGVGEIVASMVAGVPKPNDKTILKEFPPCRKFKGMEKLK